MAKNLYAPKRSNEYSFQDHLARFFGIPSETADVKEEWTLPNGKTYTFTGMDRGDIYNQSQRGGQYDVNQRSRHWQRLPFSFDLIRNEAGNDISQHEGYFEIPTWSAALGRPKHDNLVFSKIVLDDGTELAYDQAMEFLKALNDYRVNNFQIADRATPFSRDETIAKEGQNTYLDLMQPRWNYEEGIKRMEAEQSGFGQQEPTVTYRETGTSEPPQQQKGFFENLAEFFGGLFK